jgi:dTDP-glucose pyrophosphorylase
LKDWTKAKLNILSTFEQGIEVLQKSGIRIVLIIDEHDCLLGTLTDGDVRRNLLKHMSLDIPVSEVMNTSPVTASKLLSRDEIVSLMGKKGLLHIPIVDENNILIGLEVLQDLIYKPKIDNPVFIMAGGFGTRLRPLTLQKPKPLLKVGGEPILETIIKQFIGFGFHNFYISTHYKAEMIQEYFKDGSNWAVSIQYIDEKKPLGTAGSLGLLPKLDSEKPIIMMNADLLTKVNFNQLLEFHYENNCEATMCVRAYDFQVPYGVVQSNDYHVNAIVEKPIHKFFVNAGIYVMNPNFFQEVNGVDFLDMPTFINNKINTGSMVNSFPIHEYWVDIGRIDDYEKANIESKDFI